MPVQMILYYFLTVVGHVVLFMGYYNESRVIFWKLSAMSLLAGLFIVTSAYKAGQRHKNS